MKELIKVYEKVTEKKNLKVGQVQLNSKETHHHVALVESINRFAAKEGWLCYQSEVVKLSPGRLPDRDDQILFGELVNGDMSLHVYQYGAGWLMTTIEEMTGEECLLKEISYAVNEKEKADYHVYWKKSDPSREEMDLGYQPKSYRFIGFSAIKGGDHESTTTLEE